MKLKQLELFGFKSFADRTVFDFDDGLTVFVGPNGCGKSNVVDAVKWALGETKPTSLRGKEMQDVLFGGTSSRKALGLAEVSLIFENEDHALPVDFDEVVVTRRLYRDGGSEFLINRTPCRLRDLRELFMDTGTGVESYSMLEQGKIDALLQAGPKDRRAIFDEASGISKYKARRKETERRLLKVEANLERLQDVLDLTLKRERSVKIQAGRARRFREMSDELRRLRLRLALHRYHLLLGERREAVERIDALAATEGELGSRIQGLGEEIRESEVGLEAEAGRLREAEGSLGEAEAGLVAARERLDATRRLAEELAERMERDRALVERADGTLSNLRGRRAECESECVEAAAAVAEETRHLEEAEGRCHEARDSLEAGRAEREAVRRESLRILSVLSELENRRARVEADCGALTGRLERLDARLAETEGEAVRLRKGAEDAEAAATSLEAKLSAEDEGIRRREAGVEEKEREVETTRAASEEMDREIASVRSRREVLVNLQRKRDGVGAGVQAVLAASNTSALAGVRGMVADYLEVEVEHAPAVETLLGDRAQAIVIDTIDDALRAIDYLRDGNRGRATFLALDRVREGKGGDGPDEGWLDRDSLPVWAQASADLVRSRNGCGGKLMSALLGDAVVVDGLDGALELLNGSGGPGRVVTGGGDLLESRGLVTGGRGDGGGGLVSRNAEIREIGGILTNLGVRRDELAAERDRTIRVLETLRRELEESRERRGTLREARAQRLSEAARFRAEAERLTEALGLDRRERETCREEGERLEESRDRIARQKEEVAGTEEELRERGARLEEELDGLASVLNEAEEVRTERRIAIARAMERKQAAEVRRTSLERELGEVERGRDAAHEDRAHCERRLAECEEEAEEARRSRESCERDREAAERRIEKLRTEVAEARQALRGRRDRSDDLQRELEGYRRELQDFRLKENESRLRIEALIERAGAECGESLESIHEEGYEDPEDVDWAAAEEEASQIRTRLDRLGHVNLDAIRELEELEDKSRFLQEQKDDLVSSRETLLRAIREINERSRVLFLETFQSVREEFRKTFRKLFGGGRADVMLEDESDPLECGIEIVARPPGKELRSIGLLSGGERTMAAVALMFSFFAARPTPFVILDEVDAALDEANIDRFLGLLEEHLTRSQFVIITHSRRTMSVADAIYGVTMAESGVSRKVAMRLAHGAESAEEESVETLTGAPRGGL